MNLITISLILLFASYFTLIETESVKLKSFLTQFENDWHALQKHFLNSTRIAAKLPNSRILKHYLNPKNRETNQESTYDAKKLMATSECSSDNMIIWNNPLCAIYAVNGGLEVCGDIRVGGRIIIMSGLDITEIYNSESKHIQFHCTRHESEYYKKSDEHVYVGNFSANMKYKKYDSSHSRQLSEYVPDSIIPGTIVIPNADLYVSGQVHVGGSIIAEQILINSGAEVYVGLEYIAKHVLLARKKYTESGFSGRYTFASPLRKRENKHEYSPPYDDLESILSNIECPIITPFADDINDHKEPLTEEKKSNTRRKIQNNKHELKKNVASEQKSLDSLPVPEGEIITTVGSLIIGNAATVTLWGNLRCSSVIMDDASSLLSACGQIYTNVTDGIITAVDSSMLMVGGVLESQTSGHIVQNSASSYFRGGLIAAHYVQIDQASLLYIGESMLTATFAVDDSALAYINNFLEVTGIVETIDNAVISVGGNATLNVLNCFDGAEFIMMNPFANDPSRVTTLMTRSFVVADESGVIDISGSNLYSNSSIHITNSSSLIVRDGNVMVNGMIRAIKSTIEVHGNVMSTGSVVVAKKSHLFVAGDLQSTGVPTKEIKCLINESDCHKEKTVEQNDEVDVDSNIDPTAPAFYAESAFIVIGRTLTATNSWIQLRGGTIMVVNIYDKQIETSSLSAISIKNGVMTIDGESFLNVTRGDVYTDLGLHLQKSSSLYITNGMLSCIHLTVAYNSKLICDKINVASSATISEKSTLHITNEASTARFGGDLLTVDTASQLIAPAIYQQDGDIFVDDLSELRTTAGSIVARNLIVAQDRSSIFSNRDLISLQNGIISENGSNIQSLGLLKTPRGTIRRTHDSVIKYNFTSQANIIVFSQAIPKNIMDSVKAVISKPVDFIGNERGENRWMPNHAHDVANGGVDLKTT